MTRREWMKQASRSAVTASAVTLGTHDHYAEQVVTHRRWQFYPNGVLASDGEVVGQWLRTLLPSPGRMRAGRFTVVQLVTSDCHLMIAVEVKAPSRERVEQTVACIELAGSRWFPLNGNATLVTGGDGPDELKVTLAEVM